MNAYKVEATLNRDGVFMLEGLPFRRGDTVEIIVLHKPQPTTEVALNALPLQGTVLRYEDPLEPAVAEDEWDVLN